MRRRCVGTCSVQSAIQQENFMQFKVHDFCKLAKFAKFSLCEMFSLKRYKVDFNSIA